MHPPADRGNGREFHRRSPRDGAAYGPRITGLRPAAALERARRGIKILAMGRTARRRRKPVPSEGDAGLRSLASGDGSQSRCLHQLYALRPRLPRGSGERRDRDGSSRQPRKDRVRFRRPDGRQYLRRVRRMRSGLSHRCAFTCDGCMLGWPYPGRPAGRVGLPVLRRRLPAHLQHQGRQAAIRRGARRTGEP